MRHLVITLHAAVACAAPVVAGNILVNPGFESGDFTGWLPGAAPAATISTDSPRQGGFAARWTAEGRSGVLHLEQYFAPPSAADITSISVWCRLGADHSPPVPISIRLHHSATDFTQIALLPDQTWRQFDLTAMYDRQRPLIGIEAVSALFNQSDRGNVFLDDFQVNVVPGAHSGLTLAVAAALPVLRRRRRRGLD